MAYFDLPLGAGPGQNPVFNSNVSFINPGIGPVRERALRPVVLDQPEPCGLHFPAGGYRELDLELEAATSSLWCYMRPDGPPSFTPSLLGELISLRRAIANHMAGQPLGG